MLNLHSWDHMNGKKGLNNAYLTDVVEYHKEEVAFAARPATTWLLEHISQFTGLSIGWSFTILNFVFLCIAGILVSVLSFRLKQSVPKSYLSQILFWLSFPILFAFFPMIYSYDDPLQYVLILGSLVFLKDRRLLAFLLLFFLSLLVRESGLILLPGILWILLDNEKPILKASNFKLLGALVLPAISYFIFSAWYANHLNITNELNALNQNRWVCFGQNFGDPQFRIESIVSFFLVCLLPILTWPEFKKLNSKWAWAFLGTLILNTILVLIFTRARESRLFFIPLLLWLPYSGQLISGAVMRIVDNFKTHTWQSIISLILIALAATYMSFRIYQPTGMKPHENWHQEYLFVLLTFAAFINLRFNKT